MTTPKKLSENLEQKKVSFRGVEYTIRELTANEYDEVIELAGEDALLNAVLKLMALKCIVEPKQTLDTLGAMGFKVYNELMGMIREMHFGGLEPDEDGEKVPND